MSLSPSARPDLNLTSNAIDFFNQYNDLYSLSNAFFGRAHESTKKVMHPVFPSIQYLWGNCPIRLNKFYRSDKDMDTGKRRKTRFLESTEAW